MSVGVGHRVKLLFSVIKKKNNKIERYPTSRKVTTGESRKGPMVKKKIPPSPNVTLYAKPPRARERFIHSFINTCKAFIRKYKVVSGPGQGDSGQRVTRFEGGVTLGRGRQLTLLP